MKKILLVLALSAFFASCNQNRKMAKELCECSSDVVAAAMELKEYEASLSEEHEAFIKANSIFMSYSVEEFESIYESDDNGAESKPKAGGFDRSFYRRTLGLSHKLLMPNDFDTKRFKEILVLNETVEDGNAIVSDCFSDLLEKYGEQDPDNQQAFIEELRAECPDLLDIANL